MSNRDLVMAYTPEYAAWLDRRGYARPPVHAGNRLPTPAELLAAFGDIPDSELDVRSPPYVIVGPKGGRSYWMIAEAPPGCSWDDDTWDDAGCFTVTPSMELELTVVIALTRTCGQQLIYPDSGRVAVVVDGTDDPASVAQLWVQVENEPDPWEAWHRRRHGRG